MPKDTNKKGKGKSKSPLSYEVHGHQSTLTRPADEEQQLKQQWRKLQELKEVTLAPVGKPDEKVVFFEGQDVFIVAPGTPISGDAPLPGDRYWKAKIIEMRGNPEELDSDGWLQCIARVAWYYSAKDLDDQQWLPKPLSKSDLAIVKCLGRYELVLSDHDALVPMSTIAGLADVVKFDDTKYKPELNVAPHKFNVHPQDWFHRFDLKTKTKSGIPQLLVSASV
ncbi:hypothetical protein NEOLEDRAFT_1184890 [Neolentinus lepideus HHB14362 ss-1]|uniref:BAH domain-containing protein n=1 Tax=Neolentinus lepideus HHB14362 ss-1 TaxID=1314782 RepID=A0A165K657_9AGAM|nr:hypothetical protein NEOLEDRAFT_1184890 [Neolentinus lepideus HHB14362 ss-1]